MAENIPECFHRGAQYDLPSGMAVAKQMSAVEVRFYPGATDQPTHAITERAGLGDRLERHATRQEDVS